MEENKRIECCKCKWFKDSRYDYYDKKCLYEKNIERYISPISKEYDSIKTILAPHEINRHLNCSRFEEKPKQKISKSYSIALYAPIITFIVAILIFSFITFF